jgi:hypothetical protein
MQRYTWDSDLSPPVLLQCCLHRFPSSLPYSRYECCLTRKVTPLKVIGIVIGFSGLVLIFFGDISLRGSNGLWGAAMIVVSSAAAGFTAVFIKRHLPEVDDAFDELTLAEEAYYSVGGCRIVSDLLEDRGDDPFHQAELCD